MKRLFAYCLLLMPVLVQAQNQSVGALTIFSEDGDKFTLILNGEKQNEIPQANVRVEDLPQPVYNARILFQDGALGVIEKANLPVANPEGTLMDVTYKVRKDKNGKLKLNYFSAVAIQSNYIPPAGMYVHHFGRQDAVANNTTTTTTTTMSAPATTGMTMSAPGMTVTINQPVVTETTTVTTTNSSSGTMPATAAQTSGCSGPMEFSDFAAAKKTVSGNSFEDGKLSSARTIVTSNCLCVNQIMEICRLFGYEETKLTFAKFAYKYCVDPRNYFKVVGVFSFDASKEDLNHFIGAN